ncbi:hypothetical protein [Thermobacillus sp.]|uniref:hypothetical protein n=1 Tax=Thermobacillus sp. TaxID=2108467 RepID=UPI00338FED6E
MDISTASRQTATLERKGYIFRTPNAGPFRQEIFFAAAHGNGNPGIIPAQASVIGPVGGAA